MGVLAELEEGPGFCFDRLGLAELETIRALITAQYLERIAALQPSLLPAAREHGIARYHELPIGFDHGASWPKATRLLDPRHVADFTRMAFFRRLRDQLGPSAIISHDELNWRLVRPHQPGDVGPLHADRWFWDAGYGSMPCGYGRFKIWMAIHTEPGANGLCIKPHSHRQEWKHHFEERDGVRKPVFDEDPAGISMELLEMSPGDLVLFHDDLLHGGIVNRGKTCRVSLELTVLYVEHEAEVRGTARQGRTVVA
jgi:hypothetical protein